MKDFSPTEFLHKSVYPNLDAVDAGLLDNLNPKKQSTSGSYPLVCPACNTGEGFYFPYSAYINCPRKKECGRSTSVWDAMLRGGYESGEVFSALCKAAGVEPPKRERPVPGEDQPAAASTHIGKAIIGITQKLAKANAKTLTTFQSERGYTDEQMAAMGLGYYSTAQEVMAELSKLGFSADDAIARGYVDRDSTRPTEIGSCLTGRIVGYWPHQDGDVRLWGRIPTGPGDKWNPKYRFGISLKRDIPYLLRSRQQTILVCVEGTMDAWALQLSGIWGVGIGGSSINAAQATYMHGRGVSELAHMVDGDHAGWNGAISSIRNCESLGIVTSIVPLGAGMDDADALLRNGRVDQIKQLIEKRINAGLYLALMLRSYLADPNPNLQLINKVYATAECLTPVSRHIFDTHAALLGPRFDLNFEAARLLGNLLNAGTDMSQALSLVQRKTGITVSFTKDQSNG